MEDNLTTITSIIDWLTEIVKMKQTIDHHEWVKMAQRVNILIGDEHNKLFDLQQKVNQQKVQLIEQGKNVSTAKLMVEAGDDYKEMCKQKAFIERCNELIRLSKLQARLVNEELTNY